MSEVNILIGGDVCPGPHTSKGFEKGSVDEIFGGLKAAFRHADLCVVNLEAPLTDSKQKAVKTGPCLKVSPFCINGLVDLGIDVVGLGNNHIMDYGKQGLADTLSICDKNGISVVGAGNTNTEAARFEIREINGVRIAIAAYSDHEWSVAERGRAGANLFGPIEFIRSKKDYDGAYDFLIVLLHMGNEHFPLPNPGVRKISRFLIEEGASLVLCQHSHCIGAKETYQDGEIYYGQGNLIFDRSKKMNDAWYQGQLVSAKFIKGERISTTATPYRMDHSSGRLHPLDGAELEIFSKDQARWAQILENPNLLAEEWRDFSSQKESEYLSYFSGLNKWGRRLNRFLPLLSAWYTPARRRLLLNCIRCQAHREIIKEILKKSGAENS